MPREEIVAGQFYPSDKKELKEQIKKSFLGLVSEKSKKNYIGVISPHAGYMFSGRSAAIAYNSIPKADTFIILGLSHSGYSSCISLEDWKTPLGIIKNDTTLGSAIGLPIDEKAHASEHSIEVQLPFLQYLFKDFKIVPIIVSSDYNEVASKVFDAVEKLKRKVIVIASSDFTHYGFNYGYIPFREDIAEKMKELDKGSIEFVLGLDSGGFLSYIKKTGATICGKYPIAALIEVCKKMGANSGKLLSYYTSGDVFGDYTNAVGYASIIIKK